MQVKVKVHASVKPTPMELAEPLSSLSGMLYLQVGDDCFPAPYMGTYSVCNLGLWIQDAMRLLLPDTEVESMYMDCAGKLCMRRFTGSDDVEVRFCDNDDRFITATISYKRYLAVLRGAAKGLLNEIEEKGLHGGASTDTLRDRLIHLERLEEHIKTHGLP